VKLELRPLIAFRDYHSLTHENGAINSRVDQQSELISVCPYQDLPTLYLANNAEKIETTGNWYRNFEYDAERERGLDFQEDLFNPCVFSCDLNSMRKATVIASTEPPDVTAAEQYRVREISRREKDARRSRVNDDFINSLTAAADQYISYTTDPTTGNVIQTDLTDPRGIVKRTTFDSNGLKTSDIFALGKPEQQTITYNHDPTTTLLTSVIDGLNRETDVAYDANGNATGITRLAQTSNAVTSSFTYTSQFNQLETVTDPLNHTTTFQYDGVGNLLSITDPLNHQTTFTSNSAGQVATATDAMQNTIQFSYDAGDLVGITDPLGNSTTRFADNVGRLVSVTNALGRITKYTHNPLDQITQISDPLQGATNFSYDLNGNLLTVQDANQNTTTYTYNDHDLVATRTDPLQRTESYTYDTDENVTTFTDRKGQVTTYQYDNLNRLNFVGFGTQGSTYASTISYQYDGGNRVTQATDSISGILTRGYDGLDRLSSETTPQGSIGYTYDDASRRATMQVAGQVQLGYTFDNANRLTQIAQGGSTVGFTYDNANRRSTLTLPNGIVATYSYDNDSHLAGISYALSSTPVGILSYGYDALGMRNSVSGSFARTGLPQPVPSASYDAGNELFAWNELALSYDSNGNMLSDGTHSYSWEARNHLSTIDSGSTGSFMYDPRAGVRLSNLRHFDWLPV
jgi:YD repeat-containing protein